MPSSSKSPVTAVSLLLRLKKRLQWIALRGYASLAGYGQQTGIASPIGSGALKAPCDKGAFILPRFQRRHAQGLRKGCRFHYLGLANPAHAATINASDGGGQTQTF